MCRKVNGANLANLETLGRFGEANHVVRTADLDKREVGIFGQLSGNGCFARIGRPLHQDGNKS